MSRSVFVLLICFLIAGALSPVMAEDAPPSGALTPAPAAQTPVWTVWGAGQYALANDGAAIWIGAVGSALRYDKQTQTYRRYTAMDGLPHTAVLTIAVDADGNRWFGGDAGLSRLDPGENWTHVRQSPGGLYSDLVDGIAVVGGDTLYLSHGLPSGAISRRDPDGTWRWFPNRETAIQADYAAMIQMPGTNPVWTVAGTEVWAGTSVFDGAAWHERPLPSGGPLRSLAADSRGHAWALGLSYSVYEWDGSGWISREVFVGGYPSYDVVLTTLAIDQGDTVWLGSEERPGAAPYDNLYATIRMLDDAGGRHRLPAGGPVVALLSTPEGVWALGPGWLMQPDYSLAIPTDAPRFKDLPDAAVGTDGKLWLYSGDLDQYSFGAVQTLDDRGTLPLEDDAWQVRPADYLPSLGYCEEISAFERSPDGIWYASYCNARFPSDFKAVRYIDGTRIEYPLFGPPPVFSLQTVSDIFTQDARHTWFAVSDPDGARIIGLDDRGTPADTTDDSVQTIPIGPIDEKIWVAVDARGQLWHSRASGLFRYTGSVWQLVYSATPVCDLVPAADGTLYAQAPKYGKTDCEYSDVVLTVHPDGKVDHLWIVDYLVQSQAATMRTARHRNNLWAIGSDAAIWYIDRTTTLLGALRRRGVEGLTSYTLPVDIAAVRRIEVDGRGHVWLLDGSRLWRMEGPAPKQLPLHLYLPLMGK
jgi:streptogramin lyase